MMRLRLLLPAAIFLCLGLAITAANSDVNVSGALSNTSSRHPDSTVYGASPDDASTPGAIIHNTIYNEHGQAHNISPTFFDPNRVQAADSRLPEEWRMRQQKWQGEATLEVSMFSDVVTTSGNLTGPLIYNAVWQTLNNQCPDRIGVNDSPPCWDGSTAIPIRYKTKPLGKFGASYVQIAVISSRFGNPAARKPLFGALAAAYEAMTSNDMNCFTVKDNESNNRYCNVAYQVSTFTPNSYIYMSLMSDIDDENDGDWNCCETREYVDSKLDTGDVQRFKAIYPTPRSMNRDVKCHRGCSSDDRTYLMDVDKRLIHVMEKEFF
ncbi:hypothetical protein E8E12_000542 [Didymella heteroderae]|uniref:Uncharacterized protein n=1 Tax=Didymella heteroderae TaxID=1769908 RepID=A0A9P5BYZ6_9PLEO|nr:hypothetical protein E8E12_000542 [Didymella heteroderae]